MSHSSHPGTDFALAFETSGVWGSVALGRGTELIDVRTLSAPMRHSVEFLATVEGICRTYDVAPSAIRCVYVSCGPGSFTGLRIGVTAARMIALSSHMTSGTAVGLVPVPTLDVIAQNAFRFSEPPKHLVVILDAKRGRVYAAAFARHGDGYVAQTDPAEVDPVVFLASQPRDTVVMGDGVHQHRNSVEASGLGLLPESSYTPRAETVFELGVTLAGAGKFIDPKHFIPTYIRPPEAEEKWKKRQSEKPV